MTLDLTSPESIVAWYRAFPERHGPQLKVWAKLAPQFRTHIVAAVKIIKQEQA